MTDHKIDCVCSACGARLVTAFVWAGPAGPLLPGDPVVCKKCGARLVYDSDRRLRSLTPREFLAFKPEVRTAINAARRAALEGDGVMVKVDPTLLVACVALCSLVEAFPW